MSKEIKQYTEVFEYEKGWKDGGYVADYLYEPGMLKIQESEGEEWRSQVTNVGMVYLPHSCGEWVIGGVKEIEALIKDLQEALLKIKGV